jgi:hypothetical protein
VLNRNPQSLKNIRQLPANNCQLHKHACNRRKTTANRFLAIRIGLQKAASLLKTALLCPDIVINHGKNQENFAK